MPKILTKKPQVKRFFILLSEFLTQNIDTIVINWNNPSNK